MFRHVYAAKWLTLLIVFLSIPVLADSLISKEKAVSLVSALPEVKAWSKYIEEHSKGMAHSALVAEFEITKIMGRDYWPVRFYEDQASHAYPWETFLVRTDGRVILIENELDPDEGPLSLEQWRKTKKPFDRVMEK